ncbi:SMP-30/gluconolactonase/LRE family protein [Duganella sp. FT80W]|uniref:SMP-30/gluconolactonase/LRE family protein n=1 Tax=Duganella guangzhouensis TaxID=2666084 RepID=A0A6I2LC84_9BURK|nr:SMP-30/gluconolactonase/LRE family protein [Duganella guangzhouensis]MRW94757.1 SMP-30/gluconolactonase/LRE family protein [Duganella guangzhouensis]
MKLHRILICLASAWAATTFTSAQAAPAACSGKAPSGELTATRIAAANSTRSEPGLYEGPVWIKNALYFSDFTFGPGFPSRVMKLDASGKVSVAIADSGSNGLATDGKGNLLAATHKWKSVSLYTLDGQRRDVVREYKGKVFNSPNDMAMTADGTLYFSDPDFQRTAAPGGQDKTRVYRVAADGKVSVVEETLQNPNGVSLSPQGDVLYVNGMVGEHGVLRSYAIVNGVPQQGKDLVTGLGIPDGMAVDCHGNIYVSEHTDKRLRVFTPSGQQIATIKVDANVTNAAFGGADGKTLYITGAGALWQLKLDVTGSPY